jgi:transcriptional regulator with XRE-family HTH domain
MNIGERLKELRNKKNMTLRELAEKVNTSNGFLSDIENGKSIPSISKLEDICNALDITLEYFFKTNIDSNQFTLEEILNDIYNNVPDTDLPLSALIVKQFIKEGLIDSEGNMSPKVKKLLLEAIALQSKVDNVKKD